MRKPACSCWRGALIVLLLLTLPGVALPPAVPRAAAAPAAGSTAMGSLWTWGRDIFGQLGDGSPLSNRDAPAALSGYTDIVAIAGGLAHSLALRADGTVLAWGYNAFGQLGTGADLTADQPAPVQVVGVGGTGTLDNVAAIAAGGFFSLALLDNGTVVAWGTDVNGQLGDGPTFANQSAPVQVLGVGGTGTLGGVVAIAAGGNHSLALRADGTVVAWGRDHEGQLGNGATTGSQLVPVQVLGVGGSGVLFNVDAIAAGGAFSQALRSDGTVVAWGIDDVGQLGDGAPFTNQPAPVQVLGVGGTGTLGSVAAIATGVNHTLALRADGTVVAWGWDLSGQLGNGAPLSDQESPVQVLGVGGSGTLGNVVAISGGLSFSLALRADGTVVAWGRDQEGQLGNGATTGVQSAPVALDGLSGVTAICAAAEHALALQGGAEPRAWGSDFAGQLGDGTVGIPASQPQPQAVTGDPRFTMVAVGLGHSLALRPDGTVAAWGADYAGQLGNGATTGNQAVPATVLGTGGSGTLTDVVAVAAGADHSLALRSDGTVVAWGADAFGQLGNGAAVSANQATPVAVVGVGGTGILGNVVAIAAGGSHSVALRADGTVVAWGHDGFGEVGNGGSLTDESAPVVVAAVGGSGILGGVVAIAVGGTHSLALRSDGTVVAWGNDVNGQLGNGAAVTADQPAPVAVVGAGGTGVLSNIVDLAAGQLHSLALRGDGTVVAWGLDSFGQLGNGLPHTAEAAPVAVQGVGGVGLLDEVVALAAGQTHSLALKSDGTAFAWGRDDLGQLGNGPAVTANQSTPVQVVGLAAAALARGAWAGHGLALVADTTPTAPETARLTLATVGDGTVARNPAGNGSGPFDYAINTVVALTPQPGADQAFVGWVVDEVFSGWADPLTITMDADHTVVALVAPKNDFDVAPGHPAYDAIVALAARGTIRGYSASEFGADNGVQRAQMAALIARSTPSGPGTPTNGTLTPPACLVVGSWDCEDWGNSFTDRGGMDASLWRNAGTLQHYEVARGYTAADCASQGRAFPCYGPTDPVSHAQTIAFITRAMVAKGYWALQPNAPLPDPGVPGVLANEAKTFAFYTGSLTPLPGGKGWNDGATRGWFAEALWAALDSYWGSDSNLPDGNPAGGMVP